MQSSPICALVADDDPISRGIVAEQLMRLGVSSVRSASSGAKALRELESDNSIHLLVTDLKMPDMDGIALLRALDAANSSVAIIIMSALGDKLLRAAATIGVGHHLNIIGVSAKPVRMDRLSKMLGKLTSSRKTPTASSEPSSQAINPQWIEQALEQDAHHLVAQPKIASGTGETTGVEFLSRWSLPELSQFSPGDVILAAEENGLIDRVFKRTVTLAGEHWKEWSVQGLRLDISLNLSAKNMEDPSLPDWLIRECSRHSLNASDVIFEVTETAMPNNGTTSLEVASRLGVAGFQLAIDDFGTGHANLRQLQHMPFNQLKIDKSFVDRIEHCFETRTIIESSLQMARNLGLNTVAEGIESASQALLLTQMGCHSMQGYHFSRPMMPTEIPAWVNQRNHSAKSQAA